MSWLSKVLRKGAKYTPGNQIREALHISTDNPIYQALNPGGTAIGNMAEGRPITAENTLDPGNWLTPEQAPTIPINPQAGRNTSLTPNPGTGGGAPFQLGGGNSGGRTYTPNPFAQQMAQANAVRSPGVGMAPPQPQFSANKMNNPQQPQPNMQNTMLRERVNRGAMMF